MHDTNNGSISITLTRQDWAEVAAGFNKLPHLPEQDPPGLARLYETLAGLDLIPPDQP